VTDSDLWGLGEIAAAAEVSRQAVTNWRLRYDDFPKPLKELQSGPVWNREIVEAWVRAYQDERTFVLSFINLKGGVGKTTTAVAVAEILAAEFRKHVLLVDLDPQTNATVSLIAEERWAEVDRAGQTVAQLFADKLNPHLPPQFDVEQSIIHGVSTIDGGIARLDLLPSSIRLVELQDRIPMIALSGNFTISPLDILRHALAPVLNRYDYVIIDCPPSLGTVTKNGLRMSTNYIIPTVPDILSTWGIYQIVQNIDQFSRDMPLPIPPMGIVATKVQANKLHARVTGDLRAGRLGDFGTEGRLPQPPLFQNEIPQTVVVARGADVDADLRTFKSKYGSAYAPLQGLTREIQALCKKKP
jgi:chromosome partitioning protein